MPRQALIDLIKPHYPKISKKGGRPPYPLATMLRGLWNRRQCTKFNGVSYIVQRGAEAAVYSPEGQAQVKALIAFYMENAAIIRRELTSAGLAVYGGEQAPYVWIKTPGSGFGAAGEGYFRLSAFNSRDNVNEAMERIKAALG